MALQCQRVNTLETKGAAFLSINILSSNSNFFVDFGSNTFLNREKTKEFCVGIILEVEVFERFLKQTSFDWYVVWLRQSYSNRMRKRNTKCTIGIQVIFLKLKVSYAPFNSAHFTQLLNRLSHILYITIQWHKVLGICIENTFQYSNGIKLITKSC